jgi:hypothetical protein
MKFSHEKAKAEAKNEAKGKWVHECKGNDADIGSFVYRNARLVNAEKRCFKSTPRASGRTIVRNLSKVTQGVPIIVIPDSGAPSGIILANAVNFPKGLLACGAHSSFRALV